MFSRKSAARLPVFCGVTDAVSKSLTLDLSVVTATSMFVGHDAASLDLLMPTLERAPLFDEAAPVPYPLTIKNIETVRYRFFKKSVIKLIRKHNFPVTLLGVLPGAGWQISRGSAPRKSGLGNNCLL